MSSSITCGPKTVKLRLVVRDDAGLVSTNTSEETLVIEPPIATSFAQVVDDGDTSTGQVQYNAFGSDATGDYQWEFDITQNAVLLTSIELPYQPAATTVNVIETIGSTTITITGTYQAPLITVSGDGSFVIADLLTVRSAANIVCPSNNRTTSFDVATTVDCLGVIPPDARLCASLPTVNVVGNQGFIEWNNLKDLGTCDPTTISGINAITSSTATVVWVAATGAINYNLRYRAVGTASWINVLGIAGNTTSQTITGLLSGTDYEAQVQVSCGGTLISDWSALENFTTETSTGSITGGLQLSTNAFFDTPFANLDGMSETTRFYTNQSNFGNDPNNPVFIEGFDGLDADAWVNGLNNIGIKPLLCMQGAAQFIPIPFKPGTTIPATDGEFPAVNNLGDDPTDPASYSNTATMMANIALFFGDRISGIQPWNEYQTWWDNLGLGDWGAAAFCAYMKACYDAIKAVSPDTVVWWGGQVKIETNHWAEIKNWCIANNGDEIPCDKMAFHSYWSWEAAHFDDYTKVISFSGAEAPEFGSTETFSTPAFQNLPQHVEYGINLMTSASTGFPSLVGNIWCTETGYDFWQDGSPHIAFPIMSKNIQQVGMEWLLRTYTLMYSVGVAGIHQYMIKNCYGNLLGDLFCLSGLTNGDDNRTKFFMWYWHMLYVQYIEGTNFDTIVSDIDTPIAIYRFTNGSQYIYHVWSPTKDGTEITDYPFQLTSNEVNPRQIFMNDTDVNGTTVTLTKDTSNQVLIDANERMSFVVVDIV